MESIGRFQVSVPCSLPEYSLHLFHETFGGNGGWRAFYNRKIENGSEVRSRYLILASEPRSGPRPAGFGFPSLLIPLSVPPEAQRSAHL